MPEQPPSPAVALGATAIPPVGDVVTGHELADSRRPWAVLCLVANSGQVLSANTRYFWTRWGARRYARSIGDGAFYRLKVVSNR